MYSLTVERRVMKNGSVLQNNVCFIHFIIAVFMDVNDFSPNYKAI